jgi:sugar phosphate isomerase/epimerase
MGLKCTYATFTTLYNKSTEQQEQLLQDIEDAHALGAPFMRVFRGDPPEGPEGEAVQAAAQAVLDRVATLGMRLALENHSGNFGCRLEDVRSTLQRFNTPLMGTNIDTANYPMNGQDPVQAIKELCPWVIYAHLKDVKETPNGQKATYLGNGSLPFGEIMAALDAAGTDFPLCFEFGGEGDPEKAITESLRFLSRL